MIINLSISYKKRFDNMGDVDDIRKAIHYQNQAVLATPPDHLDHPLRLTLLGQFYLDLFERISQPEDVDLAITHLQQAVLSTAKTHFELPSRMSTLCLAHRLRFQQCGQLLDLGTSTEWAIRAVSIASVDDPRLPSFLNNLGTNHLIQFRHAGDPEELSRAIEYLTQAVSLTPKDEQDYRRLHNLGNAFSDKFEHYGQIEDIDKAIELIYQGLPLIPQGHSDMPIQLNNLGKSHLVRFERLNQAEDNNKAIELFSQSVKFTALSSPDLPGQLNNLGTSYLARFQRLGRQEDIDKAIEYLVQGVELIQENQPDLPLVLNQLGISYRIRFSYANNIDDINKAISCLKRAISLIPEGSRNVPMLLNSLSNTHLIRFKELGSSEDIEKTIRLFNKVLSLTPDGHPELPGFLLNLGQAYFSRFKRLGDHQARLSSLEYFQRSAESIEGHPRFRLDAAWMWARAASFCSVLDSLKAYNRAMDIIPQLVWLGASISQRYDDVRMTGDLAVEAAANAIQVGEYRLAVEWLEQGRSIVWNQILQLRTPLDHLHATNPLLAEKITQVASKLNSTSSQNLEQIAQEHRRTALEYERLISEARQLPGFGDFLRPKKVSELMRVARHGPVVMINVHASHCDALIILPEQQGIMHVPLTNLSYPKVLGIRAYLERSLQSHNVRDRGVVRRPMADQSEQENDTLKDILIALWIDIVQPVLSALGYLKRPTSGQLPHITWCTTGALTFLPLHAAGFYEEPCERTFDFVVSSYTPTISALLTSESVDGGGQHSGVLAVGQEFSPGQSRLPGTTQELTYIKKHVEPLTHYTQMDGDSGTVLNILTAMESHSWVHMACHASQQVGDPTESGFFFQDGILSIATITQKYFKNKGLAFLSACQTATGDTARPDEAVHLASGMLMAGYPSVIATMWSIGDDDAPLVADWVYSAVMRNGKMDCSRAAEALHTATAHLREKVGETAFVKWVPYIHIGVAM
ncbi:Protein kinase rad3 [Rhizoctonia solani]|uniref:Protein kinase rad3 n=1 Tax=Rhizoctonia solani TaxID=456999 RepID=A0A0K6G7R8_9AGAM|nr:Protein kinase rad3 [Rhizoctonia solani]